GAFLALASGSRAVYLALAVGITMVMISRMLKSKPYGRGSIGVAATCMLLSVIGMELLSGRTVISPAFAAKGTISQTSAAVESHGVLTQRLRLWQQGWNAAEKYPLGTGVGTYAS